MHLFIVRIPDMKAFWHLHPDQTQPGDFAVNLPIMPEGQYKLYADIVHHTGFPETQVATVNLPAVTGERLSGDDAGSSTWLPLIEWRSSPAAIAWYGSATIFLSTIFLSKTVLSKPGSRTGFRFRIEDKDGKPAADLEPYMGMAAHAVFLSTDGNTFAPRPSRRLGIHGRSQPGRGSQHKKQVWKTWTILHLLQKFPSLTASQAG